MGTGQEALRRSYNKDEQAISVIQDSDSLDLTTKAIIFEEHGQAKIHAGYFYRAGLQKDVANGGTAIIAITCKSKKSITSLVYLESV